ncbi:unnamed protein product [Brugia timori]|uniref:Uncharacterized protein n=1 Tax=Brugia timori TaxID=42155 RepID=A0A0R3QX52_9BILA|nr:unnamed protein product [Brugia timori]
MSGDHSSSTMRSFYRSSLIVFHRSTWDNLYQSFVKRRKSINTKKMTGKTMPFFLLF